MLGVDISNHQGAFNWDAAAADGVQFAWAKATEGKSFIDKQYVRNLREAKRVGIPFGAYHYARPDFNRPKEEAEHFLRIIGKPRDGDLLPVLDFEHRGLVPEQMQRWAVEWINIVHATLGVRPIFYSYPYFITGSMGGARLLRGEKLWLADYSSNDGRRHGLGSVSRSIVPNFKLVAHQYTSNGRVAGERRLDLNHADALEPLLVRYEPVPPPVPPKEGLGPLPGPRKKPKWFWEAMREYLRRRKPRA